MTSVGAKVVVIGGGPAGSVAARALALRSVEVMLVTADRGGIGRLELVSPRTAAAFKAAGLAHLLMRNDIGRPCRGIEHVDRDGRSTRQSFGGTEESTAFVVDRRAFDEALLDAAEQAGAIVRAGRVRSCIPVPSGFDLQATSRIGAFRVEAEQVVDASGRPAMIARRLGARRVRGDRRLAVRLDSGRADGGELMRVVWDELGWVTTMTGPSRSELWRVASPGGPKDVHATCLDATPQVSIPAAGEGWVAIGDAAAAFDPVNSQGLEHALRSATVAAGAIMSSGRFTGEVSEFYDAANHLTAMAADRGRMAVYGSASL